MTKDVLLAVKGARNRYEKDLKERKKLVSTREKRKAEEEIRVMVAKIRRLTDEASHLVVILAEKKRKFSLMSESNAFRESAKRKQIEAKEASLDLEKAQMIELV